MSKLPELSKNFAYACSSTPGWPDALKEYGSPAHIYLCLAILISIATCIISSKTGMLNVWNGLITACCIIACFFIILAFYKNCYIGTSYTLFGMTIGPLLLCCCIGLYAIWGGVLFIFC